MNNIFTLPDMLPDGEMIEALIPDRGILIERIISNGQSSPPGFWYEQERDEWVVLLQGESELLWEGGRKIILGAGDWVLLPAGERHRVERTSTDPPCIWLAVHGKMV
ncbi:cupin domain-containing protein [Syntrophomonas curvata]